ncbi:hypothetical protein XM38_020740 [Halomicronema hongdechloris C2206]|uniref:Segregation and condensation protein A n=1 Tax=Halomicronema hongdechloris C2206 TaxID=1641165 RepID=A0A1Z3HLE9_9CYAN|nr:segregation/condensation protein A [Halomicronema hongdechloris]ASC71124.1 hypothetical protein XM38_020740 [Halomicronema hongdechloris C2206]
MALSLAQTAIAFLIDLAEQGEIDPWDVKVIDVIDRFLSTLRSHLPPPVATGRTAHETSLSEAGQGFLYASMLVLLKADTLARAETEPEDLLESDEFFEEDAFAAAPLPRHLENHLHRRAVATPPQRRPVTLNELIEQLETIAAVMAEHPPRARARRVRSQPKRQAVRAIAQLAHQENLSEIAAALETFLDAYWEQLEDSLTWIDFEDLLTLWPQFQPEALKSGHSHTTPEAADIHERVGVFWGLLFLSAQSKVELSQREFYQDLKVRNLKRVPLSEAEEAMPSYGLPD